MVVDIGEVNGTVGGWRVRRPTLAGVDTPGEGEFLRELGGAHTEHVRPTVRECLDDPVGRPVVARCDHEKGGRGPVPRALSSSGGGLSTDPSGMVGAWVCMQGDGPS